MHMYTISTSILLGIRTNGSVDRHILHLSFKVLFSLSEYGSCSSSEVGLYLTLSFMKSSYSLIAVNALSPAIAETSKPRALYIHTTNTISSTIGPIFVDIISAAVSNLIILDVVIKNETLFIFTTSMPSITVPWLSNIPAGTGDILLTPSETTSAFALAVLPRKLGMLGPHIDIAS